MLNSVNVYKQPAKTFLLPSGYKCHLRFLTTGQQPVFKSSHLFFRLSFIPSINILKHRSLVLSQDPNHNSLNFIFEFLQFFFSLNAFLSSPVIARELPQNSMVTTSTSGLTLSRGRSHGTVESIITQ